MQIAPLSIKQPVIRGSDKKKANINLPVSILELIEKLKIDNENTLLYDNEFISTPLHVSEW